jgi:hypothetical protein
MLMASSATGQLLFLPLLASLAGSADLLLPAYGDQGMVPAPAITGRLSALLLSPLSILRDAVRASVLWVLFGPFFICRASTNGLSQTHFIALEALRRAA